MSIGKNIRKLRKEKKITMKKLGEKIGFIAIANVGLNNILKGCFMEKRPFQHDGYAHLEAFPGEGSPSGSSFPSGHSQNSATIYSLVAMNFKEGCSCGILGNIKRKKGLSPTVNF